MKNVTRTKNIICARHVTSICALIVLTWFILALTIRGLENRWCITNVYFVVIYMRRMQKVTVCDKCVIVLTWVSGMNYLAAVNRVSALIKSNKLDSKLRNENYCKTNFGSRATQVIMDAIDSSK